MTTTDTTSPGELFQQALDRLEIATIRHRGVVRKRLGISDEELVVLLFVAVHRSVSLNALVPLTGLSRSGTGILVQRMERAGLLERFADPRDKRVRRIRLSTSGAERLRAARADLAADVMRSVTGMTTTELGRMRAVLDGVADAAEARADCVPDDAPGPASDPVWRVWG